MASVKALTDFSKLRDGQVKLFAQQIIEMMTGNTNFPSPEPSLDKVQSAITDYQNALVEQSDGGKVKTAIKRQKRKELEGILQALGWHVTSHSRNDLSILLSSGFNSRRPRALQGEIDRPSKFTVQDGPYPGSISLSVAKLPGAASYIFEYASAPASHTTQWIPRISTSRKCIIDGLISGQRYAFRVAGIGSAWNRVYSDVINRYAQ